MLSQLHIANFALIDRLDLELNEGLTVFTGETGSGKSILLGALNLILGQRADYSVIRDSNQKTVVEGHFLLKDYQLQHFFDANELDYADEGILRREISAQGKSRAFINDTPVSLQLMQELGEKLIHIHSQHHTLELRSAVYQMDVLDYLTGSINLRTAYQELFKDWNALSRKQKSLQEQLHESERNADYIKFQLDELDQLKLDEVDYQLLMTQLEQADHQEQIIAGFEAVNHLLESDQQVLDILSGLKQHLDKISHMHPDLEEMLKRIESSQLELKDVAYEALQARDRINNAPADRSELEQQVSAYQSALHKHRQVDQEGLRMLFRSFQEQNNETGSLQEALAEVSDRLEATERNLMEAGQKLSTHRHEHKTSQEKALMEGLELLKMPGTLLAFDLQSDSKPGPYGLDQVQLLFSPNAGMPPRPIEKVASGGELSRLMLVTQMLLSAKKMLPTMVFDEIDTGVSGEVAEKLGLVLQRMGKNHQVWAITHLPQVAARGANHYKVSKAGDQQGVLTKVELLNAEQRVEEIARLMSGSEISSSALDHARNLLNF